jgi:acetolactate synthase-1/2/3 large subunit
MGGGVPGGVAAALRHPDRQVVVTVGDGGFQMTGQELATAVQFGAAVKIFIANNASLAAIRVHQERQHPGRPIATDLNNPDFTALAGACGALGIKVETIHDVVPAVAAALAAEGPVVVDVRTSLPRLLAAAARERKSSLK